MNQDKELSLLAKLEGILFIIGEPVKFSQVEKVLGISREELIKICEPLAKRYQEDENSAFMLVTHKETLQLATKSELRPLIETITKGTLQESLSKAQLEVLAIISYRGPISRVEIEAIRGVNCSYTLRALLLRELIERDGNPENLRGYVYTLSNQFLLSLGMGSQAELPDFEKLSQDKRLTEVINADIPELDPQSM
jgi:segregation and condensation protein B